LETPQEKRAATFAFVVSLPVRRKTAIDTVACGDDEIANGWSQVRTEIPIEGDLTGFKIADSRERFQESGNLILGGEHHSRWPKGFSAAGASASNRVPVLLDSFIVLESLSFPGLGICQEVLIRRSSQSLEDIHGRSGKGQSSERHA
jgi:hypothetical protein